MNNLSTLIPYASYKYPVMAIRKGGGVVYSRAPCDHTISLLPSPYRSIKVPSCLRLKCACRTGVVFTQCTGPESSFSLSCLRLSPSKSLLFLSDLPLQHLFFKPPPPPPPRSRGVWVRRAQPCNVCLIRRKTSAQCSGWTLQNSDCVFGFTLMWRPLVLGC